MGMTYSTFEHLESKLPEVKDYTRAYSNTAIAQAQQGTTEINFLAVDDSYFRLFNTNFISGDKTNITLTPSEIIITDKYSKRAFGNEDPLGKVITFKDMYGEDIIVKQMNQSHL